jgi:hypothetical protein
MDVELHNLLAAATNPMDSQLGEIMNPRHEFDRTPHSRRMGFKDVDLVRHSLTYAKVNRSPVA